MLHNIVRINSSERGEFFKLSVQRRAPEQPLRDDGVDLPDVAGRIIDPSPVTATDPSQAALTLEVEIQDREEPRGHRSTIWDVVVKNAEDIPFYIPPLVAKIANNTHGRRVAEEAGMYQYLHDLQGTMIPRFYGLFFCLIGLQEFTVVPWVKDPSVLSFPRVFDEYNLPNTRAGLTILLLENVGVPISSPLCSLTDSVEEEEVNVAVEVFK